MREIAASGITDGDHNAAAAHFLSMGDRNRIADVITLDEIMDVEEQVVWNALGSQVRVQCHMDFIARNL